MVANGQLENPKSRVKKIEVGDIDFHETFLVMKKLTSLLIGLSFLQRKQNLFGGETRSPKIPLSSMQIKTADHKYTNVLESYNSEMDFTIPPK